MKGWQPPGDKRRLWNVNGLGDTKLDLHDTADYLRTFQIVTLTETQSLKVQILPEYQR